MLRGHHHPHAAEVHEATLRRVDVAVAMRGHSDTREVSTRSVVAGVVAHVQPRLRTVDAVFGHRPRAATVEIPFDADDRPPAEWRHDVRLEPHRRSRSNFSARRAVRSRVHDRLDPVPLQRIVWKPDRSVVGAVGRGVGRRLLTELDPVDHVADRLLHVTPVIDEARARDRRAPGSQRRRRQVHRVLGEPHAHVARGPAPLDEQPSQVLGAAGPALTVVQVLHHDALGVERAAVRRDEIEIG